MMRHTVIFTALLLTPFVGSAEFTQAEVKLPAIFGDNMILQQDMPLPFWGKADPGESVTVTVAGKTASTKADAQGKWEVQLPPLSAAHDPISVTVAGKNTLTLNNVLVGEVWLGSGQSNMEWPLHSYEGRVEASVAKYPKIRLFTTAKAVATSPQDDVDGKWVECTPETAGPFAAVLYFMGRDLHKELGVPVGLINSSWGGTIIQCWSRYDSLITDPEAQRAAKQFISQYDDPAWCKRQYQAKLEEYEKRKIELKDNPKELQALRSPAFLPAWEKPSSLHLYRPGGLYNSKIAPLTRSGIRGVVWYQGEFNNGQDELYGRLLPKLIADWRQQWGQGDFPFLVVQLPGCGEPQTTPEMEGRKWAELREAQLKALALPNTAVVVTIDLGDGELHPRDKEPFGKRLVAAALNVAYKKNIPCYGPLYEGMTVEGDTIRIRFKHIEGGLVAKEGNLLKGFVIAGSDKKFVWADAKIDGDSVIVKSDQIPHPAVVRYAWADRPAYSLYNKAALPAFPFRTDHWPASPEPKAASK